MLPGEKSHLYLSYCLYYIHCNGFCCKKNAVASSIHSRCGNAESGLSLPAKKPISYSYVYNN